MREGLNSTGTENGLLRYAILADTAGRGWSKGVRTKQS